MMALLVAAAASWPQPVLDARSELASAVQVLARGKSGPAPDCGNILLKRLSALKAHAAVARWKRLERRQRPARLLELLLWASPPPLLALEAGAPAAVFEGAGGRQEAEALLAELRQFWASPLLAPALEACAPSRAEALAAAGAEIARGPSAPALAEYLGVPLPRYRLIAAPGFDGGDDRKALRAGPEGSVEVRLPRYGGFGLDRYGNSVTHQLAHPSVFSWTRAQPPAPERTAPAFCGGWKEPDCLDEQIVLAVEARLLARAGLKDPDPSTTPLPALIGALQHYESDRGRYPDLGHFVPVLREAFSGAARRNQ